MKKIISLALSILMTVSSLIALPILPVAEDTDATLTSWVGDNNYHVYPEDYDKLVRRYTDAKTAELKSWSGSAWRNDHATSRIDMLTKHGTVNNAELVVSDLVSKNGKISKENISFTYLSDINAITKGDSVDKQIFDVITRDSVRTLEKEQLHCAWVDIFVPEDTPAGTYTGKLYIRAAGKNIAEFDYTIEVLDMVLPHPDKWSSQLELWMYPYSAQRYYSGKSSEEYFGITRIEGSSPNPAPLHYVYLDKQYEAALESQLELYRQAGGDSITATVVHDAWNSQTPDPYPSMIKWTKQKDGTFTYDYTDFDYWVELNMKHGIDGQIKVFSMAGIGWGIIYYDEATRTVKLDGSQPGTPGWKKMWTPFIIDFMDHLSEKGWLDITYMAMDERLVEVTTAVIDLVKSTKNEEGKTLKISCAINNMTELEHLFDQIDDLSIFSALVDGDDSAIELCEKRREAGLITTLYTCGGGNVVTHCDPAEAAHAVYKAYKYNSDGVMRWAFDAFNADPHTSTYHTLYCPGDIYLIYPDKPGSEDMQAMSTPRYEKYTEGLRDMEKMTILRALAPELNDAIDVLMNNMGNNLEADAIKVHARIAELTKGALLLNKSYSDVKDSAWYKNAVRFAMSNNLMNGVSETKFDPNGSMTRAMFVTVLARLDGATLDNNATSVFKDVPSGQWYTGAIAWATKSGLLYGVGDGKFAPNGVLTREQTATLLLRYAERKKYDTEPRADITGYKDYGKIGSYAKDAFAWANAKGIIKGVSATSLDPKGNCTRAQVAEMFRLFCKNVVNS